MKRLIIKNKKNNSKKLQINKINLNINCFSSKSIRLIFILFILLIYFTSNPFLNDVFATNQGRQTITSNINAEDLKINLDLTRISQNSLILEFSQKITFDAKIQLIINNQVIYEQEFSNKQKLDISIDKNKIKNKEITIKILKKQENEFKEFLKENFNIDLSCKDIKDLELSKITPKELTYDTLESGNGFVNLDFKLNNKEQDKNLKFDYDDSFDNKYINELTCNDVSKDNIKYCVLELSSINDDVGFLKFRINALDKKTGIKECFDIDIKVIKRAGIEQLPDSMIDTTNKGLEKLKSGVDKIKNITKDLTKYLFAGCVISTLYYQYKKAIPTNNDLTKEYQLKNWLCDRIFCPESPVFKDHIKQFSSLNKQVHPLNIVSSSLCNNPKSLECSKEYLLHWDSVCAFDNEYKNALSNKKTNPTEGFMDTVKCLCFPGAYAYLNTWSKVIEATIDCFEKAKNSEESTEFCNKMLSYYICDVIYGSLFKDKDTKEGFARKLIPGYDSVINGIEARYKSTDLYQNFFANGNSECSLLFGLSTGNFNGVLDSYNNFMIEDHLVPVKPEILIKGVKAKYLTFDSNTKKPKFMFDVSIGLLFPTKAKYNIRLVNKENDCFIDITNEFGSGEADNSDYILDEKNIYKFVECKPDFLIINYSYKNDEYEHVELNIDYINENDIPKKCQWYDVWDNNENTLIKKYLCGKPAQNQENQGSYDMCMDTCLDNHDNNYCREFCNNPNTPKPESSPQATTQGTSIEGKENYIKALENYAKTEIKNYITCKNKKYNDIPYETIIENELKNYPKLKSIGINKDTIFALILVESDCNENEISGTSDYGLMQINCHGDSCKYLLIPNLNIKKGIKMLNQKLNSLNTVINSFESYNKHLKKRLVLAAYNVGEGNIQHVLENIQNGKCGCKNEFSWENIRRCMIKSSSKFTPTNNDDNCNLMNYLVIREVKLNSGVSSYYSLNHNIQEVKKDNFVDNDIFVYPYVDKIIELENMIKNK